MKECANETKIAEYAGKLKVAGHPVRLKMLRLIFLKDSCVGDLWKCLDISQPVISQHLAVLKEAGIVQSEVAGNKRVYTICDSFIEGIISSLDL